MGTNYYALVNVCEHCHRPERKVHIGKSSGGWTFNFRGYSENPNGTDYDYPGVVIKSVDDWGLFLSKPNVKIIDEYGTIVSDNEFIKLIEDKMTEPNNHAKRALNPNDKEFWPYGCCSDLKHFWLDDEGNSFSDQIFS